jgi:hypothetical protein
LPIKLGAKFSEEDFRKVSLALKEHLITGEEFAFLGWSSSVVPLFRFLVITNERILAVNLPDKDPIKKELPHARIRGAGMGTGLFEKNNLFVEDLLGVQSNFGTIKGEDSSNIIQSLKELHGKQSNPNFDQERNQKIKAAIRAKDDIEIIGRKPNSKSMQVILDHCYGDEIPRFVISTGLGAGVFVAFEDRCMIIKSGVVTSFMAGSLFGGRISTFHYGEITGIEYNSGLINGVLEVLTASYEGSKNKDFWRGTLKSRNSDSNDPWTLSNCLPLDKPTYNLAQSRLNELRNLISKSKQMTVIVESESELKKDITKQLKELSDLYQSGALTDAEFTEAKSRLISNL